MNLKLVAIDWAKRSFQLCEISTVGKVLFNHKVSRVLLLKPPSRWTSAALPTIGAGSCK